MACVHGPLILPAASVLENAHCRSLSSSSCKLQARFCCPPSYLSTKRHICTCSLPVSFSISSSKSVSPPESSLESQREPLGLRHVFSMATFYNEITILDIPRESSSPFAGSRLLLLDQSGNIHSIQKEDTNYTNAYWDQFATLPPIIPEGPIAIFGLGAGTSAHLMLDLWPSCKLIGWEIDVILVDVARDFFGLSKLEAPTTHGGVLQVCIGDALEPSASIDGGFAGIVIDLFANGEILPQLQEPKTWLELKKKLKEGGRIMINCGGICVEKSDSLSEVDDGTWTWEDGGYAKEATLRAIAEVFPEDKNDF
ncbi:hypothetical protein KP509_03G085400 [Ceratopteris richardii]|uniref:S-adenosyl-L-methionine-dependent methyltransferases superfamily protein n=1 Tax=Ceratopteris richardii TaxID=49495 RepID=A0A8T2V1K5_CERRI|nr:hypothetical protein KP509_03G085400 [Ceratopteris richardii]